jgi:nicotinic acid mononucleotide adenylyltransferase
VDKNVTGAPLHERLMMLQRLALSRDWLSIAAATHGRFLDKAMAFHALYPEVALVFIVGTDTLVRVFDGKYYADRERELSALFRVCAFACANRGKEGHDVTDRLLAEPENQAFADRVWPFALDDYHAALSSTQARELLATGARNIPQVPDEVRAYILERGLYRD